MLVREDRLLVIRRSEQVVAPLAHCFPGGGIEGDETEPVALVRELWEELTIEVQPRRLLWRSQTRSRVDLAWWLAELEPSVEPCPNPAEVHSCGWYRVEELLELEPLLESNREFLAAWKNGDIALELPATSAEDGTAG